MNNCINCGAPLNEYGGCDYCGSGNQSNLRGKTIENLLQHGNISAEEAIRIAGISDMKWQYRGEDLNDGEAVVMLGGIPRLCYVTNVFDVEFNLNNKRTFTCVER